MFRPGTRGAHTGVEALLGRLGLDVLSITFQAHPLKGALRGHQSIHPHNDNTFSIVQLSLSLYWARSCSCSSTATADITAVPGGEESLHQSTSENQRHGKKQA
jgi:hypothetical protein